MQVRRRTRKIIFFLGRPSSYAQRRCVITTLTLSPIHKWFGYDHRNRSHTHTITFDLRWRAYPAWNMLLCIHGMYTVLDQPPTEKYGTPWRPRDISYVLVYRSFSEVWSTAAIANLRLTYYSYQSYNIDRRRRPPTKYKCGGGCTCQAAARAHANRSSGRWSKTPSYTTNDWR